MEHILVKVMSGMTRLNPEEVLAIENSFPMKTYSKGKFLLKSGQTAKDAYFVVEGCIRNFELADGEERTLDFYTENQSAADFNSLANSIPSSINLVCTEETTVAIINGTKEKELYQKFPRFETFCREGMEQMMGQQQAALAKFFKLNPEERYQNLLQERPGLINRVPQYQLASYLGIKPETLSRVRKRIFEKRG